MEEHLRWCRQLKAPLLFSHGRPVCGVLVKGHAGDGRDKAIDICLVRV